MKKKLSITQNKSMNLEEIKLTLTDEMICKHLEKSIKGFKSLLADIKK